MLVLTVDETHKKCLRRADFFLFIAIREKIRVPKLCTGRLQKLFHKNGKQFILSLDKGRFNFFLTCHARSKIADRVYIDACHVK